jgi:hypothetical protein
MTAPIHAPRLASLPGLRHGFFTRSGGVSDGLYASLNCGAGSKDAPDRVAENRARVARAIGTSPERLLSAYQVHSARAVVADGPWPGGKRPEADAVATAVPGLALGVLTADCAPILFADPQARVIAVAHAGWRGAVAGVLESAVVAMEGLGAERRSIVAALGPSIGRESYEVGPELEAEFLARDAESRRFFHRSGGGARPHFDLPAFVMAQLASLGLGHVESVAACTYRGEQDFFSFRRTTHRGEPDYGRQISAIVLT